MCVIIFTGEFEEPQIQRNYGGFNYKQYLKTQKIYGLVTTNKIEKVEKELEHVELVDEVSDVPCDKCGRMMVYKFGRYGKFLACPGYPECKNAKNNELAVIASVTWYLLDKDTIR